MKKIKVCNIKGKAAKNIAMVLDTYGILIYERRKKKGRRVLQVFTEKA